MQKFLEVHSFSQVKESQFHCKELTAQWEFDSVYHLMCELYPTLTQDDYNSFVSETIPDINQLFGLFEGDCLLTVASTHTARLIGGDRILWIFHMVTREGYRSRGYGGHLISYLEDYARQNGFDQLRVHSFSYRMRAHHFYRDLADMPEIATVFGKKL